MRAEDMFRSVREAALRPGLVGLHHDTLALINWGRVGSYSYRRAAASCSAEAEASGEGFSHRSVLQLRPIPR